MTPTSRSACNLTPSGQKVLEQSGRLPPTHEKPLCLSDRFISLGHTGNSRTSSFTPPTGLTFPDNSHHRLVNLEGKTYHGNALSMRLIWPRLAVFTIQVLANTRTHFRSSVVLPRRG